ncbi:MAG: S8 family serine peptidase [Candidatus Latescibacteria bacterium]|nr:S8 family serine peptidase [Candidatus Latescibacterota bacterium]
MKAALHKALAPAALALALCILLALPGPAAAANTREFTPVQSGFQARGEALPLFAPGRVLVKLQQDAMEASIIPGTLARDAALPAARTGIDRVDAVLASVQAATVRRAYATPADQRQAEALGVERWFIVDFTARVAADQLARRLADLPEVEAATVDWRAFPAVVPSDPMHSLHWGHNNTAQLLSYDWSTFSHENGSPVGTPGFDANAHAAWDGAQGFGNSGVIIAIIDSGVEAGHPDLRQVAGYDYGDNDSNPDDNSASPGHGTACAGVAAAMTNSLGTAGIAADCSIMPLKVANSAGSMYFSSIQNALYHAADNGADIISMSLGAAISSDPATDTALQYAYNAGVTILAATGNENASTISYPAINQYVIAVGAASPCGERKRSSSNSSELNPGVNADPNGYTCDGERWWGSNYGSTSQGAASAVDVIAPTILPTTDLLGSAGYDPSDYSKWFNGTSCATPYAAGVCALIKAANPGWTPAQVRTQLRSTAQDITSVESGTGWDRYTGYGMVDAAAAVGGGTTTDQVTVTYPNGGETLTGGGSATITWTSQGSFSTVNIDFSSNGGASWSTVVTGTANDGSYGWTVPSTATTQGRIRVSGGTASDTSNSNFTINVSTGGDYATLPYSTGFESGAVDSYWTTTSSGNGRVLITTANTPHSGSYQMTMDTSTSGSYATNEAWLHLDLSGETGVDLDYWWKEFGDETHSTDGVYFSSNGGASFVKVQNLNGGSTTNNTWQHYTLDLDALASANGLSLTSTFVVKFQQYDNYPISTDGFAFDDITVQGSAPPPDAITVTAPNGGENFTAGDAAGITWSWTGTFTTVSIDYSTNGGSSWTSITGSTANDGSYTWTVPAEATTQGRVRVSGGTASDASNSNFTITVPSGGDRATVPYSTGFESGAVDSYWTTASTGNGRVLITSANSPHSGSYQMTMDTSTSGSYATNEAWLLLDLAGQTDVVLDFWWKEFGDETHSTDGVYFSSNDGASFVKVQNLNGASYANNTWQHFTLDLDALASANGLALNGSFVVKFQQYDNYPIATDGFAFDDISVTAGSGGGSGITAETEPNGDSSTANGPVGDGTAVAGTISSSSDDDWFYLDVATAGNINISVAIGSSADLDWYLYNSSLTEVARGYTTSNPEAGSYNAAAGHYYLRVDGYLGATSSYTLTVAGGLARYMPGTPKTVPAVFALGQNHPNPFNPKTTIRFSLPDAGQARLFVFDVNGRQVATLIDEHLEAGEHTVDWNGRDDAGVRVSSGVYFYRLDAPDHTQTRKMLLLQ